MSPTTDEFWRKAGTAMLAELGEAAGKPHFAEMSEAEGKTQAAQNVRYCATKVAEME
jgi:hypothetical protein